jgi:hypothetical protein
MRYSVYGKHEGNVVRPDGQACLFDRDVCGGRGESGTRCLSQRCARDRASVIVSSKQITSVGFDTVIGMRDVDVEFTRTTVWGRENYGADADGNRGRMIDTIDEDSYDKILVSWEDETEHNNIPLDELSPAMRDAVIIAVEEYVEKNQPEPEEPDEPEYEPEDDMEDE